MKAVLYSKDNCQWCDRVKTLFDSVEISYLEYKYDKHFTKEQFYSEFGKEATFPQVSIDGYHVGGCKDTLQYLQRHKLL
jgi:glutaredoxin|tara:strand:+ start:695 stop:931 length:237 start_codon:yes stop_codon:yes gene_type:complete